MGDPDPVDHDTWLEFLGPRGVEAYCGLCGNSGVLDTRGKAKAPGGEDCGVRAYCICPNGRIFKNQFNGVLPPEGEKPAWPKGETPS